jgi:hypothetical protein
MESSFRAELHREEMRRVTTLETTLKKEPKELKRLNLIRQS